MQEWIIAMLVISAMLIVRDMAKTIFGRENSDSTKDLLENHPQKEQIEKYAEAFQKLADSYYEMPSRKDALNNQEIDDIFQEVHEAVCLKCKKDGNCWGLLRYSTYKKAYELLHAIEEGDSEKLSLVAKQWENECIQTSEYSREMKRSFYRARQNLLWNNRMLENRAAVAGQLNEMAHIMQRIVKKLYSIKPASREVYDSIAKACHKKHLLVKNVWIIEEEGNGLQLFLTMRARGSQRVSAQEASLVLSKVYKKRMTIAKDSKKIVKEEFVTVLFREDVNFRVNYGVARVTKEKEMVSGDNFVCTSVEPGKFIMCLADGMGSGVEACQESEEVVELLEQFLDSGFSRETAAKMINATLLMQSKNGLYSTVDICTLDLYTGACDFLKAGAAATFIKKNQWIEAISSTSLAAGLVSHVDFETASKSMEDGDYLIMVTDGVLDALPLKKEEETMKEILMQTKSLHPKELGREILENVLRYCNYRAVDDMTVLVAGISRK